MSKNEQTITEEDLIKYKKIIKLIKDEIISCEENMIVLKHGTKHKYDECMDYQRTIKMCFQCFKYHEESEKKWQLELLMSEIYPDYEIIG